MAEVPEDEDPKAAAALDIFRRLPPEAVPENLKRAVGLTPELTEELLARVDQPLTVAKDPTNNKPYLLCDYNRDGDSYRSPWSNAYYPPLDDGAAPSDELRKLELAANEVFGAYRDAYYEGGTSSVYLWDGEQEGEFAGCFLVHKAAGDGRRVESLSDGYWDAVHVVEVAGSGGGKEAQAQYTLTSTVMLHLSTSPEGGGEFQLAGSLTRQTTSTVPLGDGHLVNVGRLIEEAEAGLRGSLDAVYFSKTRDVVNALRSEAGPAGALTPEQVKQKSGDIMQEIMAKKQAKLKKQQESSS